eukprot:1156796-Pelagomonas_calceolata.AAC.5
MVPPGRALLLQTMLRGKSERQGTASREPPVPSAALSEMQLVDRLSNTSSTAQHTHTHTVRRAHFISWRSTLGTGCFRHPGLHTATHQRWQKRRNTACRHADNMHHDTHMQGQGQHYSSNSTTISASQPSPEHHEPTQRQGFFALSTPPPHQHQQFYTTTTTTTTTSSSSHRHSRLTCKDRAISAPPAPPPTITTLKGVDASWAR